ncbi:dGTPase [Butyrivibrio sp. Su6]|uniref:dGTP triphosphohydrolase n=1 Tax=Butyrivibrio sp. Su6 TaxID=1520810 RepID=UPI00089E4494|nr:dNTP triphosphohydrolase [Butyrivibrio sp. Su6]SEG08709.1 dGTPase [Butyrivibrio sp. Su6]
MDWKKLLSTKRQVSEEGKNEQEKYKTDRYTGEFDDDYLSIISSQAFRRLQDKTQVFLLDKSDFVRTRLTHSLEVSTIARQLAVMISKNLSKYNSEEYKRIIEDIPSFEHDISTIVACAGLLHDTGNPPYGHYGENVIRNWFAKQFMNNDFAFRNKPIGELLTEQMKADFANFEGNAQGLRIMSKSRHKENSHDINLTYAVMNTLVKYPNPSNGFDKTSVDVKKHKNGYYHAEEDIMKEIGEATGTLIDGSYVRHPLVYIMEAADDIAYSTADLEDAVMKRCFTVDEFIDYFTDQADRIIHKSFKRFMDEIEESEIREKVAKYEEIRDKMSAEARKGPGKKDQGRIDAWDDERKSQFTTDEEKAVLNRLEKNVAQWTKPRSYISRLKKSIYTQKRRTSDTDFVIFENWLTEVRESLMKGAAFAFGKNYDAIMNGTYNDDLFVGTYVETTITILKKTMAEYVYDAEELVEMELAAKKVVESLLENFVEAVLYYEEDDADEHMTVIDDRFIRKIPGNFKEDYKGAKKNLEGTERDTDAEKLYLRLLMVTDYISGMTDSYASNLYKVINGIM